MIGARVIKTSVAVTLAILGARYMELQQAQFAGIVAVLSVQPSLYRSLRFGLQQMFSAFMGALFGAVVMYFMGSSFLMIGLVAFVLMTLHVKIKWTNSLLLSVVVAVNTMGATGHFFGETAMNQLLLVAVGVLCGTLVNVVHKPVHHERVEDLLMRSEGMLRALLFYIYLDLNEMKITPYAEIRKQIEEVRKYIERGKEISGLIQEDKRFHRGSAQNLVAVFLAMESMIERIRDVSKELQKANPYEAEVFYCQRALLLTIRMQESNLQKQRGHAQLLLAALKRHELEVLQHQKGSVVSQLPFLNLYNHLADYLEIMEELAELMQDMRDVPSTARKKTKVRFAFWNEVKVVEQPTFGIQDIKRAPSI